MKHWYLWLGAVWSHEGAEGRPVKHGGVEGRHPDSQVSGGDADGRTLELQLLDQLVYSLQSSDGGHKVTIHSKDVNKVYMLSHGAFRYTS